jgi:hypothetical protein
MIDSELMQVVDSVQGRPDHYNSKFMDEDIYSGRDGIHMSPIVLEMLDMAIDDTTTLELTMRTSSTSSTHNVDETRDTVDMEDDTEFDLYEQRSPIKKVSFSEDKPVIYSYDTNAGTNPLVALLMDAFNSQRELENFFRVSLSKIIGVLPGLTEYSVIRYGELWNRVIEAFQTGRIDEDIHLLVTEIWPYISAPVSISRNGEMTRVWKLQYFFELVDSSFSDIM